MRSLPRLSMKNTNMCLPPDLLTQAFFGGGVLGVFHTDDYAIVPGSYSKTKTYHV